MVCKKSVDKRGGGGIQYARRVLHSVALARCRRLLSVYSVRLLAFPAHGCCLEIDTLGGEGLFRLTFGTVRYSAYSEGGPTTRVIETSHRCQEKLQGHSGT